MITHASVLGVLALCRGVLANPTQPEAAPYLALRCGVSGVLGLSRPRTCAHTF